MWDILELKYVPISCKKRQKLISIKVIKKVTPKTSKWAVKTDAVKCAYVRTVMNEVAEAWHRTVFWPPRTQFMLVVELIPHGRPLPLDLPFAPWVRGALRAARFTINKQRLQGLLRRRINNSALAPYSRRQINIDNINKRLFSNDLDTWSKNCSYCFVLLLFLPY